MLGQARFTSTSKPGENAVCRLERVPNSAGFCRTVNVPINVWPPYSSREAVQISRFTVPKIYQKPIKSPNLGLIGLFLSNNCGAIKIVIVN